VLTHDNPDPDALAAAHGVAFLLEQLAGVPSKVGYGGIVGRAENRALLKVLQGQERQLELELQLQAAWPLEWAPQLEPLPSPLFHLRAS
jgi:nanoRNase/pAp phosphatase (c-di-AMP/oligoRNAs hydrolase)